VRSQTLVTRHGRNLLLSRYVISILLGPDDEHDFAYLDSSADSLPEFVAVLRKRLRDFARDIEYWDRHLRELEQPDQMVALQAALDEETRAREHDAEAHGKTTDADQSEWTTAEIVLANQREERIRLQSLYDAVQAGVRDLEEEYQELRANSS
jgi:hypothetical protein